MPALVGSQIPTFEVAPEARSSSGAEVVALSQKAGLNPFQWQQHIMELAMRETRRDSDGMMMWAAFMVAIWISRQNGKGSLVEMRALAGLFLFGEMKISYTAHRLDTARSMRDRMITLVRARAFRKRVNHISTSHGEWFIELDNGATMTFNTRTAGSGRGLGGECVFLDEAMFLSEEFYGDMAPIVTAQPNPQVWVLGSAVDALIHMACMFFARIRMKAYEGTDPRLAYFEYCAGKIEQADMLAKDRDAWAAGNPSLGLMIPPENLEALSNSMSARRFAVEHLGIPFMPKVELTETVIAGDDWAALEDIDEHGEPQTTELLDPVGLAFDVTPTRSAGAIVAGGRREDGLCQIEVVDHQDGTGWIVNRLAELYDTHELVGPVKVAAGSPGASMIDELTTRGVRVEAVSVPADAKACGQFFDGIKNQTFRHLNDPRLNAAVGCAARRKIGSAGAWVWDPEESVGDITCLRSATLAHADSQLTHAEPLIAYGS